MEMRSGGGDAGMGILTPRAGWEPCVGDGNAEWGMGMGEGAEMQIPAFNKILGSKNVCGLS